MPTSNRSLRYALFRFLPLLFFFLISLHTSITYMLSRFFFFFFYWDEHFEATRIICNVSYAVSNTTRRLDLYVECIDRPAERSSICILLLRFPWDRSISLVRAQGRGIMNFRIIFATVLLCSAQLAIFSTLKIIKNNRYEINSNILKILVVNNISSISYGFLDHLSDCIMLWLSIIFWT